MANLFRSQHDRSSASGRIASGSPRQGLAALGALTLSLSGWLAVTTIPLAIASPLHAAERRFPAARLQTYTFNPSLNRLDIRTSADVRPRAALVEESGSLRVIVDVPNASWSAAEREQTYTGLIRKLRLAQFDPTTVRFVLDVAPDETLSDRDLSLEPTSDGTWTLKLSPESSAIASPETRRPQLDPRALLSFPSESTPPTEEDEPTHVLEIQDTDEGFFIRTNNQPEVSTHLLSSPTRLAIDLAETDVTGLYGSKHQAINRHGVYSLRFSQWQPDVARIVLNVAPFNTRWSVDYDAERGGFRVYPQGRSTFQSPGEGRSLAYRPESTLCEPTALGDAIAFSGEDPSELSYPLASAAPMSSGFGYRFHPVTGGSSFHAGIDLAAPTGTPVLAALSGDVTFAGARGNLGNAVILDHTQNYRTRYGHMLRVVVRAGDRVRQGQLIGYVGSTGRSTGPHLHFEYLRANRDGAWIALDPKAKILAATPSGANPLAFQGDTSAIGGNGPCIRP